MRLRFIHKDADLIICHPQDLVSIAAAKLKMDIVPEAHAEKGLALAINRAKWKTETKIEFVPEVKK
jgi:hypothetical protein